MKSLRKMAIGVAIAMTVSSGVQAQEETVISDAGFVLPESMRYDAENDRYLVANIGGIGMNDGFISVVSPEGEVTDLKWISGGEEGVELNEPKGMRARDGILYVADVMAIRRFDLDTGEQLESIEIPGAVSLNDLDLTESGAIFATDRGTRDSTMGAVYRVAPDGTVTELERGEHMMNPNGLVIAPDGAVVTVTIGASDVVARQQTGERIGTLTLDTGQLDGVLFLEDGTMLVTSWEGERIYSIGVGGEIGTVMEDISSPAAIGYDPTRQVLLVPQLLQNQVRLVPLPE